ncbi:hypothetical protein [Mycolicibacterium mengxianglii]|uniref:hypothetical protein n=1 Tax=Mycolicibacterium mengxianglii TaxID=2736649 RepID=UPI001E5A8A5D|nr:hypothetical protein [Mycolicibacterium mengxianglii]
MAESPDVEQARVLLTALEEHIVRVSRLIEKAERGRSSQARISQNERALRRDLYEAHRHVERLHQRFPEVRRPA